MRISTDDSSRSVEALTTNVDLGKILLPFRSGKAPILAPLQLIGCLGVVHREEIRGLWRLLGGEPFRHRGVGFGHVGSGLRLGIDQYQLDLVVAPGGSL